MFKLIVLLVAAALSVSQAAVVPHVAYAAAAAPEVHVAYHHEPSVYAATAPHVLTPAVVPGVSAAYHHGPSVYAAAAPHVLAPVATAYNLPPVREVVEAPLVEQHVEPVEQHGYSIRY